MLFSLNMFRRAAMALCLAAIATTPPTADAGTATAASIARELKSLYRTQSGEGALIFTGERRFYSHFPMAASMCLDSHRATPNAALVGQSTAAISRYYNYLFATRDRDHDLLVETPTTAPNGDVVDVEDIGFNALLALDMMSLARLNIEIRKPYRALYWYEGSRTIQDAIVYAGLDIDVSYFFPVATGNHQAGKQYHALSALPLLFPGLVGDNHATIMVREYLLKPIDRAPESAHEYLAGPTASPTDDLAASARLLKTLLLLRTLETRGFHTEAATFRAQALTRAHAEVTAFVQTGATPSAHLNHLVELLAGDDAGSIHDPGVALDVFAAVLRVSQTLEDHNIVRLETSVGTLRSVLAHPTGPFTPGDATTADMAVRVVYKAVSAVRGQLEEKSFLRSEAYRAIGAVDPARAVSRLLDDVTSVLHTVDNRVFRQRFAADGLYVTATLLRDRAITGSTVDVKWTIGAHNKTVTIRSAIVSTRGGTVPIIAEDNPVTFTPGAPQTFRSQVTIDGFMIDALEPVELSIEFDTGEGPRARFHALRTIYVEHPVKIATSFPEGRMLGGSSVPIDITVVKTAPIPAIVLYEWYSPTGIRLAEGRSGEYVMSADEDSASLTLNVVVPDRCRPGRFPFKLKFSANGSDLGTIESNLFKPYQWVFAGPFPATSSPGKTTYGPEETVRLLKEYDTAGGTVAWSVLRDGDYDHRGNISLRGAMTSAGVGFLYTVVEAGYEVTLPVFLASNALAELIVNGETVIRVAANDESSPAYARVSLTRGVNEILIKVIGDRTSRVFFNLGDENDEASYAFNNDLSELLVGYETLYRRAQGHDEPEIESQKLVTLYYHNPSAQAVSVIGTFNGWSPDQSRMRRLTGGNWEIVLSLPPGHYSYRFLVNNRSQVLDPAAENIEPDGFGGENSVMVIE